MVSPSYSQLVDQLNCHFTEIYMYLEIIESGCEMLFCCNINTPRDHLYVTKCLHPQDTLHGLTEENQTAWVL